MSSYTQSMYSSQTGPDSGIMSTGGSMGNRLSMGNSQMNHGGMGMSTAGVGRAQGPGMGMVNPSGQPMIPGQDAPQGPNPLPNRNIIWLGQLEWQDMKAIVPGQNSRITRSLGCMGSIAVTEPEINTANWPETLIMQLMPQTLLNTTQLHPLFKNSRHVAFHFQNPNSNTNLEDLKNLFKALGNGFAGCVHFLPNRVCDIRMLLLLLSTKRKAFVGLIPNDQSGVVNGIRQAITQHKQRAQIKAINIGMANQLGPALQMQQTPQGQMRGMQRMDQQNMGMVQPGAGPAGNQMAGGMGMQPGARMGSYGFWQYRRECASVDQDSQMMMKMQQEKARQQQLLDLFASVQRSASGSQVPLPSESSSTRPVTEVFFETLTEKKTRCMFEGRILTMDKSWCERAVQNLKSFDGGGYGEVFLVKHPEATQMSVVIKRIKCQTDADKARSAASILASRLLHFAIVPVLAEDSRTYYLMLPYFENKSLAYNLSKDRETIERRQNIFVLNKPARLRILYEVACAMAFLHKGIRNFRGSFVHGDITTRNIVLDERGNARLIDFGLAREYSQGKVGVTLRTTDMRGTLGYFSSNDTCRLTVGKDVFNFFVVVLEVLTSMPPCYGSNESQKLKNKFIENSGKKHIFLEDFEREIEDVWGRFAADIFPTKNNPAVYKLLKLAEKCRNETASETVKEDLNSIVSEYCQRRWEDPQYARDDNKKQCVVCLINPVDKDARNTLGHTEGCKLYVCVACMRNSYLNPIECHSCGLIVQPPIGHKWAAVLVAGNDVKKKIAAEAFAGDLKKVKKGITSRHPMIMGISEKDVFTAQPQEPGTAEKLLPKVQAAFDSLAQKEAGQSIESLLFFFTGHHSETQGFKLGDNSEYMKREELEKYLNDAVAKCGCKRVFVLLDCCNAPAVKLNRSLSFFQINASIPGEEAEFPEGEGSAFTEFFTRCLRAKSSSDNCLLEREQQLSSCSYCEGFTSSNGFMKLHALRDCVNAHVAEYGRFIGSTQRQQSLENLPYSGTLTVRTPSSSF